MSNIVYCTVNISCRGRNCDRREICSNWCSSGDIDLSTISSFTIDRNYILGEVQLPELSSSLETICGSYSSGYIYFNKVITAKISTT